MLSALHRAIVHLPIGFLMMVLLLELIVWWRNNKQGERQAPLANVHQSLGWMWMAVLSSSIVALISGTILQNTGYYAGQTFTVHQWAAYAFTLFSALVVFSHQYLAPAHRLSVSLKVILLPVVALVGHAGGELSAGPEVVAITPAPTLPKLSELDTIQVYPHIIQPIFASKCIRCHEKGNARGGILMDSPEGLLTDALGDPVIYPGDLERSLAYQRMILSPWDERHMPPSGPPLTYHEKRLVEWWIMENAPFEIRLEEMKIPDDILDILQHTFDYRTQKRAFYEKVKAEPVDSNTLKEVSAAGWILSPLAQGNHFLDVYRKGKLDTLSANDWQALEQIAENIVWLDLSQQSLSPETFTIISQMPNLYRLQLQNTRTQDKDLALLSDLPHLHTLNLFGTPITAGSIPHLTKMKGLKVLYIGQTPLQAMELDSLQTRLTGISIN